MKIARPTITASTYTAMALTSDHPNCATAPATSAKMPTGATSSTHRTMRISAWVGTSASWVRTSRLSSGSAAAATAKIVMNTISGSRLPSTAARSGFAGTRSTMKRAPDGACSAAWRWKLESASAVARSAVRCSGAMGASGSSIAATTKPIRIAASVAVKVRVGGPRRGQRGPLLRRDGRERQQHRSDDEADQDRGERRAPEEAERPQPESSHLADVPQPRDAREQRGGDERDHDHREEVQEQRADGTQPGAGEREQQRVLRRRGHEPEREARQIGRAHV